MQTSDLRLRQNLDPAAHVGPRDRLFIAHCSTAVHERGLRTHFFHARRYWKIERKAAFATTPALFRRGCTTQAKLHTMVGRLPQQLQPFMPEQLFAGTPGRLSATGTLLQKLATQPCKASICTTFVGRLVS